MLIFVLSRCLKQGGGCITLDTSSFQRRNPVEQIVNLHIEKLPEGVFLATSDEVPGLVAQGRTLAETIEIARDVAKKLIDAQSERPDAKP